MGRVVSSALGNRPNHEIILHRISDTVGRVSLAGAYALKIELN